VQNTGFARYKIRELIFFLKMGDLLNTQSLILTEVFSKLEKSTFFQRVLEELKKKKIVSIKPAGRLFIEILSAAIQKIGYSPVILLFQDEDEIFFAREELRTISGKETALFYSFNDETSLNMDEIEERLLTLDGILTGTVSFIVTNLQGLSLSIPSEEILKKNRMQFFINQNLDFSYLIERLNIMGFNRVNTVGEVGEFSVRGNIIDIYGYGMDFPKRIEFLGDEIVSLRSFNPFTQRTVRKEETFVILPIIEKFDEEKKNSILDYIPDSSIFIYSEFLFLEEVYQSLPELKDKNQIVLSNDGLDAGISKPPEFHGNLSLFKEYLRKIKDSKVFISCESEEERKRCEYLFEEEFPAIIFDTLNVGEGLESKDWSIYIITDKEIFGKGFHPRRLERSELSFKTENLSELKPSDYVVHEDYGIGIFERMGKIEHKGQLTECLLLRYEEGDILYVPINAMSRVSKYIGLDKGIPKLSNLSSMKWERKKKSAKKAIEDMTRDLLRLYAERELAQGFSFSRDTVWQKELEASFLYEETEDQLKAIKDIKDDMESTKPMDRLVCGEVGYGKTEVAIRAAFKAVLDSKQVFLLAPTTVLCEQHFNTFKERLANFPTRVEMLSRFVKKSKQNKIIEDIKTGKVDIIIGTHRLLSNDIEFYDPGLLIIDEEHRFGVTQKEKLKKRRKNMDALSMSATPIPRTLQFSLLSIRDFSTIKTPPKGRLSVITRIIHWNSGLIREIILSEIQRGGQVFFVYNRIQGLRSIATKIRTIVPEAKITVTHGRMKSSVIEERMLDFLSGRCNLLVTTSIIESGLDIPNANTIIIDRADAYGLAQLHQLRGRVGRSNRRAYCYLIVPRRITQEARKRLSTIYTHSHLGSGFALAMKDLEIRGAGNLLGSKQHGHITKIGYDLYMKLLQETIQGLKGEKISEKVIPEVYSNLDAYIPATYVEDETSRIDIYKRLSSANMFINVNEIAEELNDRFGKPPKEVENLLLLTRLKIICLEKYIKKVSLKENYLELSFVEDRFPSKKNIEKLFKEVDKKFYIDYSEGYFKIRFKTEYKKILSELKKMLNFFNLYVIISI